MSVNQIAKELGFSRGSVNKIITELGLKPEKYRFGIDAYSPEGIASIRDRAESMGLFTPEAPEGYMSVNQIANKLGIDYKIVKKTITELGLLGLKPEKYRFGPTVTDGYSPEDRARIREWLEKGK